MSEVDLSVVVPVFDSRATLEELLARLVQVLERTPYSFELIFIDDGSRDGSFELLQRRANEDPRIRPFALTRNFGSQSAVCAGFDQVRGKRTVLLDADLENLPEDIPSLLAPLDRGFDLVCGVRQQRRSPLLTRRIPSWLLNAYVRRQTGTRVRDIGCAFRAMDSALIRNLEGEGEHRRLLTPLLLRRARRVAEVPVAHRPREGGGGHSFFSLLGIALDYYLLTARRPFLVAGVGSLVATGVGLLAVLAGSGELRLAGVVLATGGLLGALASLVGEYVQRLYQLGQDLPFYQLREPERGDDDGSPGDRPAAP